MSPGGWGANEGKVCSFTLSQTHDSTSVIYWFINLHTVTTPTVWEVAVKTKLAFRNDKIKVSFFTANKNIENAKDALASCDA